MIAVACNAAVRNAFGVTGRAGEAIAAAARYGLVEAQTMCGQMLLDGTG
jgi:hypothetical protein